MKDTLSVIISSFNDKKATKRNILSDLASAFDPTIFRSPAHLIKILYREICELKLLWDKAMPRKIKRKWDRYKEDIPK